MAAHYAAPAVPQPWVPEHGDAYGEGLLRGWEAHRGLKA